MKRILIFGACLCLCTIAIAQNDSIDYINPSSGTYKIVSKYPYYNYCKNCSHPGKPKMLCGHNLNNIYAAYSYALWHMAEIGYSKDIASCRPERGGHFFSTGLVVNINFKDKMISGLKIAYLRDHLFGLQFYFLKFGANAELLTDYKKASFYIRPELRIMDNMDYSGFLQKINISYGYSISIGNNFFPQRGKHQITISYYLRSRGPIS